MPLQPHPTPAMSTRSPQQGAKCRRPCPAVELDSDDLAHLLTALADTLNGYPPDELANGWRDAAARAAMAMRAHGIDDERAWDILTG